MKDQHRDMINKQMKKLISEVEEISNVADRAKVRAKLIEVMFNIATCDIMSLDTGKDAIREDKAKEIIEEEIDLQVNEEIDEPIVDETDEEVEAKIDVEAGEEVEEETEEVEEVVDDPFVDAEEIPFDLENAEPAEPVVIEDEEGNEYDVTEEYNYLEDLEDEDKREICLQIKQYDSFEDYKLLTMLPHGYSRSIIALTMTALGTDTVDQAVETFNDGHYVNMFKFLNTNNCDEFAQYLVDNYFEQ